MRYRPATPWQQEGRVSSFRALENFHHPLQRSVGACISLLPIDIPVAQFIERNLHARYSAGDMRAGFHDVKLPVTIYEFRFAAAGSVNPVHTSSSFFGTLARGRRSRKIRVQSSVPCAPPDFFSGTFLGEGAGLPPATTTPSLSLANSISRTAPGFCPVPA